MSTSQYIQYEIPLIFDSKHGSNRSSDGSTFEVTFSNGNRLQIPKTARAATLSVESALIWWTVANVQTGVNDRIYIRGPSIEGVHTDYDLQIPQGLYDIDQLQEAIERLLENLGAKSDPLPLITLSPDEATNKAELSLNYPTVLVDFREAQTCRQLLGFESVVVGPSAVPLYTALAPNVAAFNPVEYFLIHSDLVRDGIPLNNTNYQIISQVTINCEVGQQLVYAPVNPARIPLDSLDVTTTKMWLTDQDNKLINTNNETWSCRLVLRYYDLV